MSGVSGAGVDKGKASVEWRSGYALDGRDASGDKRFRMRQHLDYGFTDWYALRLVVAQDKRQGDDLEHQAVSLEHRVQFFERENDGWDGGFKLIYSHNDGDKTPHEVAVRFMAGIPVAGGWELRHNTNLSHELGPDSEDGLALEWRHQISREMECRPDGIKKWSLGLELFTDLGRLNALSGYDAQDHQIGPALTATLENGMFFQVGYRAGLSRSSPDHLMKFFVGKTF